MNQPDLVLILKLVGIVGGVILFVYLSSRYIFRIPTELQEIATKALPTYMLLKSKGATEKELWKYIYEQVMEYYYEEDEQLGSKDLEGMVDEIVLYLEDRV